LECKAGNVLENLISVWNVKQAVGLQFHIKLQNWSW